MFLKEIELAKIRTQISIIAENYHFTCVQCICIFLTVPLCDYLSISMDNIEEEEEEEGNMRKILKKCRCMLI